MLKGPYKNKKKTHRVCKKKCFSGENASLNESWIRRAASFSSYCDLIWILTSWPFSNDLDLGLSWRHRKRNAWQACQQSTPAKNIRQFNLTLNFLLTLLSTGTNHGDLVWYVGGEQKRKENIRYLRENKHNRVEKWMKTLPNAQPIAQSNWLTSRRNLQH